LPVTSLDRERSPINETTATVVASAAATDPWLASTISQLEALEGTATRIQNSG
jgi:hypothetical protein